MSNWLHYKSFSDGTVCVIDERDMRERPYEIGAVTTGRQRVFHGYYVKLTFPEEEIIGHDLYSMHAALRDLDYQLRGGLIAVIPALNIWSPSKARPDVNDSQPITWARQSSPSIWN